MAEFYNYLEMYSPAFELFPELSDGKVYRMTIISGLEQHDVGLLSQAQALNEYLLETLEDEVYLELDVSYNPRYFPGSEKFVPEDSPNHEIVDNTLFYRNQLEFEPSDFIVSTNTLFSGDMAVCEITTMMSAGEPKPFEQKITVH